MFLQLSVHLTSLCIQKMLLSTMEINDSNRVAMLLKDIRLLCQMYIQKYNEIYYLYLSIFLLIFLRSIRTRCL